MPRDDVLLLHADLERATHVQGRNGSWQVYDARARAGHASHHELRYHISYGRREA